MCTEIDSTPPLAIDVKQFGQIVVNCIDRLTALTYHKNPTLSDRIQKYRSFVSESMATHYDIAAKLPGFFHPQHHADIKCASRDLINLLMWNIERAVLAYYNKVRGRIVGGETQTLVDLMSISETDIDLFTINAHPGGVYFYLDYPDRFSQVTSPSSLIIKESEINDEDFESLFDSSDVDVID